FTLSEKIYVPVWAVAGALKQGIVWDANKNIVQAGKKSAEGVVKGDVIYVAPQSITSLFGGNQEIDKEKKQLSFEVLTVLWQGKAVQLDVQRLDGKLVVPVLSLAELAGQKVVWDALKKAATAQEKSAPVTQVGECPYISVDDIPHLFNLNVAVNDEAHTLEIRHQ
ncbi:MAG: copper amine oxidase N-terminal domain-containing protein, partial [Pelosinus sp.]|nr:copper amine oxidase N-terminal domain-containing protein [Pelosinus sp.]